MFESIVSPIWVTNILAWTFTLSFAFAWVFEKKSEHISRKIRIVAWFLFGIFWLLLTPRFAIVMRSPIETVLSFLAIPICFHAGYLLLTEQSLRLSLSNAIAVMGIVYLPFETIEPLGIFLIIIVWQKSLIFSVEIPGFISPLSSSKILAALFKSISSLSFLYQGISIIQSR